MNDWKSSQNRVRGRLGEEIAARFLQGRGAVILERNYRKGHGEIDLIVSKEDMIVFVEVKSVTRESTHQTNVSYETYRAEENVHPQKLKKLIWTAESYLFERGIDADWRIDVVAVELDPIRKQAKVRHVENVT